MPRKFGDAAFGTALEEKARDRIVYDCGIAGDDSIIFFFPCLMLFFGLFDFIFLF